jgi:hypothetical protein
MFKPIDETDFQLSAKTLHECCLWMAVTITVIIEIVCMSRR